MSREPEGTESRIREGLAHRADRAALVPSSLGEVRRRARSIRRRRTALTVGGAAAAIIVLAGVGVALGPGRGHEGAPAPATTSPMPLHVTASASPSPTAPDTPPPSTAIDPSAPASTQPAPTSYVVDTRKVTEGNGPALLIPNWLDGTLSDGHGRHAVPVRERPVGPVLDPRTGRWHAMTTDLSTGAISWNTYGADGAVTYAAEAASSSVAVTPDGATYAVLLKDAGIGVRLKLAGAQQWETALGSGGGWTVAGILPDGKVVVSDARGGTVVVSPDGNQQTLHGSTPEAVNPVTGQIVVRTSAGDGPASCWGLVGEGGARGPETCGQLPFRFSADGSQVAAYDAGADNLDEGVGTVHLLDGRSLAPLVTFTAAEGQTIDILDAAWMGDRLAVPVHGPVGGTASWEIALLSTDGVTMIHASASPAPSGTAPPYSFGAGPLDAG